MKASPALQVTGDEKVLIYILSADPLLPWAAGCQMVALNFQEVSPVSAQSLDKVGPGPSLGKQTNMGDRSL